MTGLASGVDERHVGRDLADRFATRAERPSGEWPSTGSASEPMTIPAHYAEHRAPARAAGPDIHGELTGLRHGLPGRAADRCCARAGVDDAARGRPRRVA